MTEQRVALVTGGTRGIGRAITLGLAETGVHVAAGYLSDEDSAKATIDAASAMSGSVSVHRVNVGEPDECMQYAQDVIEQFGRVDYLVNNAGITIDRTVRRMTVDDWHKVMRVNISGAFYMVKSVIEHMIERKSGRIVNISSIIGETGNVGQANYATAKSGLFGLTKSLALELANKGITVNSVAPGFIATDMLASVPPEILAQIVAKIPVGRLGNPEDVAYAVINLCDDRAAYITGAVIPVNGGLDM
jgi:acetoacetyl-CoA reductase